MKKIKNGQLIVIEGLDGSGKATQTKLLVQKLKKEGYLVKTLDFPRYHTFFGKIVGKYLRGEFGGVNQINSYFTSLLYALDRWEAAAKIKKWLHQGKIIICNRYTTANQIYQSAKIKKRKERENFLLWLKKMEYQVLAIPQPNLILYLDVPFEIGQKLVNQKKIRQYLKGAKKDIHEKNKNYLKNVQKIAEFLIKKEHWQKIICLKNNQILPKKEISQRVWSVVKNYLRK